MNKTYIVAGLLILLLGGLFFMRDDSTGADREPVVEKEEDIKGPVTNVPAANQNTTSNVTLAFLDTEYEGEPQAGCDRLAFVERTIPATTMPLTAAMETLFSLEETNVAGNYNFIAKTNDTLSFDRAVVENGTAKIYLTGRLSGLGGVCDDPRARIQIEETAKWFSTVKNVEIYLNGDRTDLTPSEQ